MASNSLHICYLCNEYPPAQRVGGIGIFTQTIARGLVSAGHKATIVGLYEQSKEHVEDIDQGVRVIRLSARARYIKLGWLINRYRMLLHVRRLIEDENVDIVEAPDYEGLFWLAPRWHIPRVARLHGSEVYFRRLLNEPLKLKHLVAERNSLHNADAIGSVSKYTWQETKRLFGLPDRPVEIIPNPVDMSLLPSQPTTLVVPGRILYTGTFIRKKGVFELFSALPRVFVAIPEAHLVCVGADAYDVKTGAPSSQSLALSLLPEQFRERVAFFGRVNHERVLASLQSAQVCAFPSFLEAFPIAWIEAMAAAKPVVASNTGSGPEVIEDGVSGLLCHPTDHQGIADRLIALLRDHDLALRLGIGARDKAIQSFSLDRLLPENIAWYCNAARTTGACS